MKTPCMPVSAHSFLSLILVGLFFCHINDAYPQHKIPLPNFKTLKTNDGLPTNEVQKVFQDKEGFMWFATRNGLCKYDGYQITVYNSYQGRDYALKSNNVYCLADDNLGNLWVGTYNGINRFDKITGRFETIDIRNTTNKTVHCILVTRNNEVWIGLDDGLFKYDPHEKSFTHHSLQQTGDQIISASVRSIIEDHLGEIWIGTSHSGLYRYSPAENIIHAYPKLNERNFAHVVYQDSRKNIWVGTWGEGLYLLDNVYDKEMFSWKTYQNNTNDPKSLLGDIVYDICEDINTNTLWIGTQNGLSILEDHISNSFINWSRSNPDNTIVTNEINSIIRDNKKNLWIGSIGSGVLFTNTEQSAFNHLSVYLPEIPTGAIRSIFLDHDQNIWLGVGTYGIVKYNEQSDKMLFQLDIPEFEETELATTYDFQQKETGEILIGTYGEGLWVYQKDKPVEVYTKENCKFINDNRILSIHIDQHQHCWIGTQSGLGVWLKDGSGYVFPQIEIDGHRLETASVTDITGDDNGRIWITTVNDGIISIDGNALNKEDLIFNNYRVENEKISSNTISALCNDRLGRLWAGTESGKLYLYDKENDSFVDKSPHFTIVGSLISSIEEDLQGNLWISTNNGLVRLTFNKEDKLTRYRIFTSNDGLSDDFFIPRSSFANQGELFFGGYNGVNRFYTDNVNVDIYPTPFYFTDIKIQNTSFHRLDEKIAKTISNKTPPFADHISIPYKYNNFSVHFANLNFRNPELNRYAYRLIGHDQEWKYTGSKQNAAYYNNLSPGQYVFQLRATTQNGVWNDKIKEIQVNILPPFWRTWWSYVIYFFIFILIFYLIYRNALNRIRLKNQLLYKEFEKMKSDELNHAKLQFFTNITHELLTPLTIISATVDELKQLSPEKDNLHQTIQRNIHRLSRLLQQILEFRKAETGNLKLRVSYGNISEFVKNTSESFYPLIKKNSIHFSFVSDPENIQGLFDPDKLDKILYNLISNAAKYVPKGGSVQVNLAYYDEQRDQISLSVRDNGSGISKEEQQTLFKRFYEGKYRNHNTTGTGIGLSLVKDLVTLYHGTVNVESEINKGSVFSVVLPIDISFFEDSEIDNVRDKELRDFCTEEANTSDINEVSPSKETQSRSSILIVEDNEEILQLIQRLLKRDYQTYTATNGDEAISILKNRKIDLIISDIMMPGIDGIQLCQLIKQDIEYSHIPIILLTAKTEEKDRADAYESGADAFITKPFNLNVLHARIKNLLKRRENTAKEFKNHLIFELKDMEFTDIDKEFIQKAIDCVHRHIEDSSFDQQQFSEEMNMSKSTLYNKLKNLTGLHTSAFITNIRMKTACKIMDQNPGIRISDLAYTVGFNDPKYFSACFKKEFNMRPSEYIERFTHTVKE